MSQMQIIIYSLMAVTLLAFTIIYTVKAKKGYKQKVFATLLTIDIVIMTIVLSKDKVLMMLVQLALFVFLVYSAYIVTKKR